MTDGTLTKSATKISLHFWSVCHQSFSWISWIDRRHTDSQQCSEPRPQTAPSKVTGGRQDYHDFEALLPTMLLVLASQEALTDWTRQFDPFLYQIDLYLGPLHCFVTPDEFHFCYVRRRSAAGCSDCSSLQLTLYYDIPTYSVVT